MDRISTSTKAVDLYGPGKHGFKNGNLSLGNTPTDFNAEWCNGLQEELLAVIEGAGLTPDAGTLNQLQQAIQLMIAAATAQDYKASVRAATTANIAALAGGAPNTLDGVALVANDRILVKDQATPAQNGIYVVTTLGTGANGTWTRATDADGVGELTSSAIVGVEEGAIHADTLWMLTTDGPITIGTTPLTFARKDSSAVRQIQPIGASVAANALTVTVQPTTLDYRDATLSSGTVNTRTLAAAASLVVPSGATLGTVNGVLSRLVVLLLDNAGTLEPAIVNLSGGVSLDETGVISTTAISAAATSASVVYSQTARANVPYRVVGIVESTQAAAGTWATAPSRVQGAGGQAVAAMQSLGFGQTWQNVGASRGFNTTYYNTTGRPIQVVVNAGLYGTSQSSNTLNVNGLAVSFMSQNTAGANTGIWVPLTAIIPPGGSYSLSGSGTITSWFELR